MADIIKLAKYTQNLYEGVSDLASGKTRVDDLVREQAEKGRNKVVRSANSIARNMLGDRAYGRFSDRTDSLYVENRVRNVLNGKYDRSRVNEVPLSELDRYGAVGMHKNGDISIPLLEDIPKAVPNYKSALKESGKSEKDFKQDMQNYILMHEVVESWYQMRYGIEKLDEDSHGKLEAMVLKAYNKLSDEGYGYADSLSKAAMAMHSGRGDRDSFKRSTMKYLDTGAEAPDSNAIKAGFTQKMKKYLEAA